MRTLRVMLAAMLASAAVVPLLVYGFVSITTIRTGIRVSVVNGNTNVAYQVAAQVRRYVSTNLQIFQALSVDLENTGLDPAKQDRLLKSFVLRFPEFRELNTFDLNDGQIASSRIGAATTLRPSSGTRLVLGVNMTPVVVDSDLMPASVVTAPVWSKGTQTGWLVGQFSIEELWRLVDRIRIGQRGVALVVGPGGELLAHGNPDDRVRVARGERLSHHPVVAKLRTSRATTPVVLDSFSADGLRTLSIGVLIPDLDWIVLVEQPYQDAFALARQQERELTTTILLSLLVVVVVGVFWSKVLLKPVGELTRATRALAAGELDARVRPTGVGELGQLGSVFNEMAVRLATLQDDVRRQERHAMFGRVAAGLVHDLSHPFMNIQNNCKLVLKMYNDPEYRQLFGRTTEREFATIRRVFDDLRNISRPMPLEHYPLELNRLIVEVTESVRANADVAGIQLQTTLGTGELYVAGDRFAIGRVCRNLLINAIEATPTNGRVSVTTEAADGYAWIVVSDTGCGIPPARLPTLFEDFSTTKRQGLGLGLAISKKIVDQLGGTITATSEEGRGATFAVRFPLVMAPVPDDSPDAGSSGVSQDD